MGIVYGHMVKAVSGKLMAVVTNGSTSMSLSNYATLTKSFGASPVLPVKAEIGVHLVTLDPAYTGIAIIDSCEVTSFNKEDAIILARKILTYYEEEL